MSKKHVPLRTCVQCREVRPKRELVRIVRTPQGEIKIDETGKAPGRGAYLCLSAACWEPGVAGGRLDQALKTKLSPDDRERLLAYARQLSGTDQDQTRGAEGAKSSREAGKEKGTTS
jgi:predicted RNA-binding protein YlxR (DUF448 family)